MTFRDFDKQLADPDTVTVNIYIYTNRVKLHTGVATKESLGVYYYYYTIPDDANGSIVCEFVGTLSGNPVSERALISVEWV